ncbi:YjfB family protein [Paenibacillus sp. SC116]|uniref:YjfB family protein n=1 Tax=Paenibacillus sp. SC116 TaxID=2968986 RepID=UPI00215AA3AA|nr:YjfB family protein [Paenibacillus sp. SC116]MCR8844115.1 YjfB family protein [Paenibacillus sp. SC116]
MNVASMSVHMNQNMLSQAVSLRVTKMSQDLAKQAGNDVVRLLQQSVQPNLGGNIDIKI